MPTHSGADVLPTTQHDPVTTLRLGVLTVTAIALGGVALLCACVAVADLASHDDDWDGLGAYIAAVVGVPVVVVALSAVVARRTRSRLLAGITAAMLVVGGVAIGSLSPWGLLPFLVGLTLLVTVCVRPAVTR